MENIIAIKKTLNNKSRKGEYIYVREKGKAGRYYRTGNIDEAIAKYKQNYGIKKGKYYQHIDRHPKSINYRKILTKRKPISSTFKKGVASVIIDNIELQDNYKLKQYKKQLLSQLVKDNQMLDILSEEQNFNKLMNRLDYQVHYYGENNTLIAKQELFNKTPEFIRSVLRRILTTNPNTDVQNTYNDQLNYLSEKYGLGSVETIKNGKTYTAKLIINLRKG